MTNTNLSEIFPKETREKKELFETEPNDFLDNWIQQIKKTINSNGEPCTGYPLLKRHEFNDGVYWWEFYLAENWLYAISPIFRRRSI